MPYLYTKNRYVECLRVSVSFLYLVYWAIPRAFGLDIREVTLLFIPTVNKSNCTKGYTRREIRIIETLKQYNMKHLRTIILTTMAIFVSQTNANAQEVETKVVQQCSVTSDKGWRKYFYPGTSVTIFAYKKKDDSYKFGIYTDDYAGLLEYKVNPFAADEKQLKKLPNADKKKAEDLLLSYYNKACAKAREKSLSGKYRTIASCNLYGKLNEHEGLVDKNDTIIIVGYKEVKDFLGTTSYYAVVNNKAAGVFDALTDKKLSVINIPLNYLPSTDDPQVKAIIVKEEKRIIDERLSREKKEREERAAIQKSIEEQEFANLKFMDPAYIEVKKINMDSAGGNEVSIKFTNCSSQKVKYVYFTGYFLNAVGDKCRNEVGGSTVWKYTGVGPVSRIPNTPDRFGSYIKYFHSDPLFYSKNARRLILSSVTIEYMNGKKIVLSGSELEDRVDYSY